jgi:hypothetical protein
VLGPKAVDDTNTAKVAAIRGYFLTDKDTRAISRQTYYQADNVSFTGANSANGSVSNGIAALTAVQNAKT